MATEPKKPDVVPVVKKQNTSVLESEKPPDVTQSVMDAQSSPVMIVGGAGRLISKIIKWVGLIALIIFLVTNKPVREKVVSVFESVKKGSSENERDTAVFEWWKEPHQYGQKRSSGPINAVITRNDENVFNFELVYFCKSTGRMEKGFFEGEKVSLNRIEGTWSQAHPEDNGHWYLVQDIQNLRLFKGSHSDKTGDNIKCRLKIKLK